MTLRKYFGDKKFYRTIRLIAVPIMVQNGLTNFVSLLDNIMVGSLGTEAMSGVSIVNQFIFIFYLLIFGAVSASGIFMAQYHGVGNREGKMYIFRFKLLINIGAGIIGIIILALFQDKLISLFLHKGSTDGDLAQTLIYGKSYLNIMLMGLIPYVVSQVYASSMRETEQAVIPMIASIAAVASNFILNYILIFGKLGAPVLGVTGAAIATVISRFLELFILIIWAHTHINKCSYLEGAFKSLHIPAHLTGRIVIKGLPLMANEVMWALAVTVRNQAYSTRGLDVVASLNICNTVVDVFSVLYKAFGNAIVIIIGNLLGAGALMKAKDYNRKMLVFAVICGTGTGIVLTACSGLFPLIYNTTAEVRQLASYMIIVTAVTIPFVAYAHSAYFTLCSGGKVLITILFDSVFMWSIVIPTAIILSRFTAAGIHLIYLSCQFSEILKAFFGFALLRRSSWVKQLVSSDVNKLYF